MSITLHPCCLCNGGPILTTYTAHDVFLPSDVPFGGFVDMPPYLGVKFPQNPNFGGLNRRSTAKLLKLKNMHIIKTAALIRRKFCTLIKTTKCPWWVVETRSSQIQDGGRLPSGKNRKIAISRHRLSTPLN